MKFEYDPAKNQSNIAKHGISFEQAKAVFNDADRLVFSDKRQAYGKERLITIGLVENVLTVVYTLRNASTRIISARRASKNERKNYQNPLG